MNNLFYNFDNILNDLKNKNLLEFLKYCNGKDYENVINLNSIKSLCSIIETVKKNNNLIKVNNDIKIPSKNFFSKFIIEIYDIIEEKIYDYFLNNGNLKFTDEENEFILKNIKNNIINKDSSIGKIPYVHKDLEIAVENVKMYNCFLTARTPYVSTIKKTLIKFKEVMDNREKYKIFIDLVEKNSFVFSIYEDRFLSAKDGNATRIAKKYFNKCKYIDGKIKYSSSEFGNEFRTSLIYFYYLQQDKNNKSFKYYMDKYLQILNNPNNFERKKINSLFCYPELKDLLVFIITFMEENKKEFNYTNRNIKRFNYVLMNLSI